MAEHAFCHYRDDAIAVQELKLTATNVGAACGKRGVTSAEFGGGQYTPCIRALDILCAVQIVTGASSHVLVTKKFQCVTRCSWLWFEWLY